LSLIEISSTLRSIRQGELETVAIGHRTASAWDYIDLILPPRIGNLGAVKRSRSRPRKAALRLNPGAPHHDGAS
jgi:hypothetical protein